MFQTTNNAEERLTPLNVRHTFSLRCMIFERAEENGHHAYMSN